MAENEMMKAKLAKPGDDTIFGKIVRGEIPTTFIHEDEQCVVFKDINPQAPVHFLVVPRKPLVGISEVEEEDEALLGHLLFVAKKVAKEMDLTNGYRVVINNGRQGGQTVYHLHVHVLGGREFDWPPG